MKNYFKNKWCMTVLIALGLLMSYTTVCGRYIMEDYSFILLMPSSDTTYVGIVFPLSDLKVCRFPNGPMWSNSIDSKTLYYIPKSIYTDIKKCSQKLHMLCLDFGLFKSQCQNDCQQSICGFALPWEQGMAYVFDDLKEVDRVTGFIIEKSCLSQLQLERASKKIDVSNVNQSSSQDTMGDLDLDEINLLIDANLDEEYVGKYLPYPFQDIKNFIGKIVISCLMRYHNIRQKLLKFMV